MIKLYKKDEVTFAIICILIYCGLTIPIRGQFGDDSIFMLISLLIIATGLTIFIKKYKLEEKYGLKSFPKNPRKYLYFLPIWILTTGNLWGGIKLSNFGMSELFAILSMILIGYIEEIIFRGFLFKGMLPKDGVKTSIIVASVTFGIGHIVNLIAGQTDIETIAQIIFAISWGFMFTSTFYKSKSLIPCILSHSLVDAFSRFSCENPTANWIYIISTVIIAILYCTYLLKLPGDKEKSKII